MIIFMIVGIMAAFAQADDKQRDRIREQKKIYKQLQDQLREQKRDQLREQKRDGSCQEEDEAFLAFLKSILDDEDPDPAQNRDRIREQKKTQNQLGDQLRDQKRDQLREQKQDGSCQEEDEELLEWLKSILGEDDPEPAQNRDRIREQKKTQSQLGDQLRDQKRDQLREKKQDGSCQDEGVLKANDDADPNKNQIRIREQKKTRDQLGDQLRDQKRDQLREKKQDGSCQDEGVLKANDDTDPNKNQIRIREQKKTQSQLGDQLRDQKRDQLREKKQDGSCQDGSVLKANDDVDPYQNQTLTREQKKQQDQLKKRSQIWRKIKNYFRWKAPGDA